MRLFKIWVVLLHSRPKYSTSTDDSLSFTEQGFLLWIQWLKFKVGLSNSLFYFGSDHGWRKTVTLSSRLSWKAILTCFFFKSVNLQYDTLVCWDAGTKDSSTKRLMFQALLLLLGTSMHYYKDRNCKVK